MSGSTLALVPFKVIWLFRTRKPSDPPSRSVLNSLIWSTPSVMKWLVRGFTSLSFSSDELSICHQSSIGGNSSPLGSILLAIGRILTFLYCIVATCSRFIEPPNFESVVFRVYFITRVGWDDFYVRNESAPRRAEIHGRWGFSPVVRSLLCQHSFTDDDPPLFLNGEGFTLEPNNFFHQ